MNGDPQSGSLGDTYPGTVEWANTKSVSSGVSPRDNVESFKKPLLVLSAAKSSESERFGSLDLPLHAWVMNTFGLSASVGHFDDLNSDVMSSVLIFLPFTPTMVPWSPPWDITIHTNASYSPWSFTANSSATRCIWRFSWSCLTWTSKSSSSSNSLWRASSSLSLPRRSEMFTSWNIMLLIMRQMPLGWLVMGYM